MPIFSTSLIQQLTQLTGLAAMYHVPAWGSTPEDYHLLICEKPLTGQVYHELKACFQQDAPPTYRIYDQNYAVQQFETGNVFFGYGMQPVFLKYSRAGYPLTKLSISQALKKADDYFKATHQKALAFQAGAQFYIKEENYAQAAFMLHQAFELSFRTVELFAMGKEKVCHRIKNHQIYVQDFLPELAHLFKAEDSEEQALLKSLDTAYRDVRYGQDYQISFAELEQLSQKLSCLIAFVENEFTQRKEMCLPTPEPKTKTTPPPSPKHKQELQALLQRHYEVLNRHTGTFYQRLAIPITEPFEHFLTLSHLIKVCILALEHPSDGFSKGIPQPYVNIQATLEFALQLLPYEEMEFLQELVETHGGLSALLHKQEKQV